MSDYHPKVKQAALDAVHRYGADQFILQELAKRLCIFRDDKLTELGKDPVVVRGMNGESVDQVVEQMRASKEHRWAFSLDSAAKQTEGMPDMSHLNENNTVEKITLSYKHGKPSKLPSRRRIQKQVETDSNATAREKLDAYYEANAGK